MRIFDSHCHLDDEAYEPDRAECLLRAGQWGVDRILNPGYDIGSSWRAARLAGLYDGVWAAVGIHPQKGTEHNTASLEGLKELVRLPKVAAIGEIGLDYYWMESPKQAQHDAFVWQLELAGGLGLPVIVHSRDAASETYQIVKANRDKVPGIVMHCYSGSAEMAMDYVKLGCMISLVGPVTFNNAKKAREVAEKVPLSGLMVETDGPYLAPMPYRGKRNEPAYTKYIVEKIAEIKGITAEEVASRTYDNAVRLFGIEPA